MVSLAAAAAAAAARGLLVAGGSAAQVAVAGDGFRLSADTAADSFAPQILAAVEEHRASAYSHRPSWPDRSCRVAARMLLDA